MPQVKCADSSECFGWHQDCAYADLGPAHKLVTAWVALSDSSEDNGCVRMVSGARYPGLLAIIIVTAARETLNILIFTFARPKITSRL